MRKEPDRIVELPRVSFEHFLCEEPKENQEDNGAAQPGNKRGAQTGEHSRSIHLVSAPW